MDLKDIAFLVQALMIHETSESDCRKSLEKLYKENNIIMNKYHIRPKKILPLRVWEYSKENYYSNKFIPYTIFRPVMEVDFNGETVSFVHNLQEGSLVFVGPEPGARPEFYSLIEGAGQTFRHIKNYKLNKHIDLQEGPLLNYLEAYFDLGLDLSLLD